jgi:glucose/arabinose dehydrogenase
MRTLARGLLAVCLVACGGKDNKVIDAPGGGSDAPPDAPDFLKCASPVNGTTVSFRALADKLPDNIGVLVTSPPNDLRLFVVDRSGEIFIYQDEHLVTTPFIDLQDDNGGPVLAADAFSTGETGLLGMAFHPNYAQNRTFFVTYTRREAGDSKNSLRDVLARCTASETDPMKADPTCTEVLAIPDFASNHNGGMIEFGSDGFLYMATGDGGSAGDPNNNGQALVDNQTGANNTTALLGKMLRLDVDNKAAGKEYGIPADNPFAGGGGAPEIFAIGLRNAWRWSFDRANGDVWIGDVGQGTIEELDYVKAGTLKGKNFGWSLCEGSNTFKTGCDKNNPNFTFPQDERTHGGDGWVSITGGQVYRGTCYPDIVGTYYYTDFMHGGLTKATANADGSLNIQDLPGTFPGSITSIHEVATGEVYATDLKGQVFHLEAAP